jgi:NADPH2:quinone reductase
VKAVLLRETGGPERLELVDVAEPEPKEGERLVRVGAAGINYLDVLIRRGEYPQPPELPAILGAEIAGEVDGRRVIGLLGGVGGYAEAVAVPQDRLFDLPDGATFAEGAAFLLTFLTAWIPLTRQVQLEPEATVLVHAASGGVGTAAIQVARHLGARAVAVASSEEKRQVALDLGAEEAYGYEDFTWAVRADVVLDPVGGEVFSRSVTVLQPLGTLVAIGFAGGFWEEMNPALLVGRNVGVQGFYLGRLMQRRPDVVRAAAEELLRLWSEGALRPLVGAEFPLDQAAQAHRLIDERRHVGKVVLVP